MKHWKSLFAALLIPVMLFGLLPGEAFAAEPQDETLTLIEDELPIDARLPELFVQEDDVPEPEFAPDETVRVSIVLEQAPTIEMGYPIRTIGKNGAANLYRNRLKAAQENLIDEIEELALDGEELDVELKLTLAANAISANVEYQQIEDIRQVPGVKDVVIETVYEPLEAEESDGCTHALPTTQTLGAETVHDFYGYTGAGIRIAILDSGVNDAHRSFNAEAFEYSLTQNAPDTNGDGTVDAQEQSAYRSGLNLMTEQDIQTALEQDKLNVTQNCRDAAQLYKSSKIPYAYNYCDNNLRVTNLEGGYHGSHVSGTAAANAYIKNEDGSFSRAIDAVGMAGVAPDAQILNMKVMGSGACTDSVLVAAMEDAIILGADVLNLSLGSAKQGYSCSDSIFGDVTERLAQKGVLIMGALGNEGSWVAKNNIHRPRRLYADDVNLSTATPPSSYADFVSVAWADGEGFVGHFLQVEGASKQIFCNETSYNGQNSASIGTLAAKGTIPYLYVAAGEPSAEQANGRLIVLPGNAAETVEKFEKLGALGVIFVNSELGVAADTHSAAYAGSLPVVTVTKGDGALLRAHAAQVDGTELYEGKLTVDGGSAPAESVAHPTMDDSSSYGIPSSLMLSPEITAFGTGIYSVYGLDDETYAALSGTSMASPMVAGMAAVVEQALQTEDARFGNKTFLARAQEQNPDANVGKIAGGLLLSTADPMRQSDGSYYTLLRQGAGLANVKNAVRAESYIDVAGQTRGRVKAEVGESRENQFTYTFTLHNLSTEERQYTLSTDLFTQKVDVDEGGTAWLSEDTRALENEITYSVDGRELTFGLDADVNRDNVTNEKDAQDLLEYLSGKPGMDLNLDVADLNDDDHVTTYDAHLILEGLTTEALKVPAGESVTVKVDIHVTDALEGSKKGAYLEGFTYVRTVSPEGADVTHSIPILGYCGSWSDPSMFDHTSYADTLYHTTERASYTGVTTTNCLTYLDPNGNLLYHVGNPFATEETYPENKLARRSDDILYTLRLSLIRQPGALALVILERDENGNRKVKSIPTLYLHTSCAYPTNGNFNSAYSNFLIDRPFGDLGVKDGDKLEIGAVAVPEYYESPSGKAIDRERLTYLIEHDILGEGAYFTMPVTVDDQAPKCTEAKGSGNRVTLKAEDNENVAYVALYSTNGLRRYAYYTPTGEDTKQVEHTFDNVYLTTGSEYAILVGDYAGNTTMYRFTYGSAPNFNERAIAYAHSYDYVYTNQDRNRGNWLLMKPKTMINDGYSTVDVFSYAYTDPAQFVIAGADAVDDLMFQACEDGTLYVSPLTKLNDRTRICDLHAAGMQTVQDLAFCKKDKMLYATDGTNVLWRIDPLGGAVQKAQTVSTQAEEAPELYGLAIDETGKVYATSYSMEAERNRMLTWNLADVTAENSAAVAEATDVPELNGHYVTMNWGEDGSLLAACAQDLNGVSTENYLWQIWRTDGGYSIARANNSNGGNASRLRVALRGLVYLPSVPKVELTANAGSTATALRICNAPTDGLLNGDTVQLYAAVNPWTVPSGAVTWESKTPELATIDQNGVLLAKKAGKAQITATCRAGETELTATCEFVISNAPDIQVAAFVREANGSTYWETFSTHDPTDRVQLQYESWNCIAGTMNVDGNCLYVRAGYYPYMIDPATFKVTETAGSFDSEMTFSAIAPAHHQSMGSSNASVVVVLRNSTRWNNWYGLLDYEGIFSRKMYLDGAPDGIAVMAYKEQFTHDYAQATPEKSPNDADRYYMMAEDGTLYLAELIYAKDEVTAYERDIWQIRSKRLGQVAGVNLADVGKMQEYATASMIYDKEEQRLILVSKPKAGNAKIQIINPETATLEYTREIPGIRQIGVLYQYDYSDHPAVLAHEQAAKQPDEAVPPAQSEPTQTEPIEAHAAPAQEIPAAPESTVPEVEDDAVSLHYTLSGTTNGLWEVEYDPTALTFLRVDSSLAHIAYRDDGAGMLKIAFADANTLQNSDLTVVFTKIKENTKLTVKTLERDAAHDLTETEIVELAEKTLTELEISKQPSLRYPKGGTFTGEGMELTLHFSDGSTQTVTDGWHADYDFSRLGETDVKITYQDKTVTLHVTVYCEHTSVTPHDEIPASCTTAGHKAYTRCNDCGEVTVGEDVEIPALGHQWAEPEAVWSGTACTMRFTCTRDGAHKETREAKVTSKVKTPATCTVKGTTTYTATAELDGKTYTATQELQDIPLAAHTASAPVQEKIVNATCTQPGSYDEVIYCSVCRFEMQREHKTNEMLPHTPGTPTRENEKDATCTAEGSYEEVIRCSVCGTEISRETKTTEKIAHTPGTPTKENVKDATCTAEGSYEEVIRCTVCGTEISRDKKTTEKLDHTPGTPTKENEKAATCTSEGSYEEVIRCTVCNTEISRDKKTTEKLDHTPGTPTKENEKAATCTAEGSYEEVIRCTVCNTEISRDKKTTEKLDHTPGTPTKENEKKATCTESGSFEEVTRCSVCGTELDRVTRTVAPTGHTEVRDEAVAPTCTQPGKTEGSHCSVCGVVLQEQKTVAPTGHMPGAPMQENEKTATCTEEGSYEEVVRCTVCGYEISREKKTTEKLAHTPGTPTKENEKPATCTAEGSYEEVTRCTVCQTELDRAKKTVAALGHAWDAGSVTREPSEIREGERLFRCTRCGETRQEPIAKLVCDFGESCPSGHLTDVPTNWAHAGIDYALRNGLMNGMEGNTFRPETPMTRGMLVTVLWRYAGSPDAGTDSFADVAPGRYYTKAVAWAAQNGVVNGVGENRFDPEGNVTREQMVTILYRYAQKLDKDSGKKDGLSSFPDANTVSAYAKDAAGWAVAEGILNGSDGKLLPKDNATRAEVAAMLMRCMENVLNP